MLEYVESPPGGASQASREDKRGFALPIVLVMMMVLSTLSVLLVAGAGDVQRAGRATAESARSFYAAEAGLNAVLSAWDSLAYDTLAPNPGDSADLGWTGLEGGSRYRVVFARVDGGGTGDAIHSLRVVGQGAGNWNGSTTIFREVGASSSGGGAQTLFDGGNSAIEGGTDGGNVDFQGGGSVINGFDMNPAGWTGCDPLDDKPGIIWQDKAEITGESSSELKGNPDQVEDPTLTTPDLLDFGGLDFDSLAAMAHFSTSASNWGPNLSPVVSGGACVTTISSNWGAPTDPSSPCHDWFPIIHFSKGSGVQRFSGCGNGQGIILVENGNMEIEGLCGPFNFYGIIITRLGGGGSGLELADTDFQMYGSVILTTNAELDGGSVRYSQCVVKRALEANGLSKNPSSGGGLSSERMWRQATN